jgi:hypothetical protein
MRKVAVSAAVVTATILGVLPGNALGRGILIGIPNEARVTSYRIKLSDPKPSSIDTFDCYGAWTDHAFFLSWDKKHLVFQRFLGLGVRDDVDGPTGEFDMSAMTSREITFSPDSHHFVVSQTNGTFVVDSATPKESTGKLKSHELYKAAKGIKAYGGCWLPDNSGFFILEEDYFRKVPGSRLRIVPSGGGEGHVILDHPTRIRWFMTPESRYRNGQGPIRGSWKLIFAASDGLWLMNGEGGAKEKLCSAPPDIFQDIEWSPTADLLLAVTRDPITVPDLGTFQGVYLVHPGKKGGKPQDMFEVVDASANVHTIYFSPKGKYISWATPASVKIREVGGKPESAVTIDVKDKGVPLAVQQFSWDDKETRLLITAKNKVFVYDVAKKTTTQVAAIEDAQKTIVADPTWLSDDEILVSAFTDIAAPFKR